MTSEVVVESLIDEIRVKAQGKLQCYTAVYSR